jgi:hypothetical protein
VKFSLVAGAIAAIVINSPAGAFSPEFDAGKSDPDVIGVHGRQWDGHAASDGGVRVGVRSGSNDPRSDPANYVMTVALEFDPATGATCARLGRRFVLGGASSPQAADSAAAINQIVLGLYPLCPGSAPAPAQLSAGAAALQLWHDQVKLPPPAPRIAPGWGIVGKDAYLEIGGRRDPVPWTFTAFGYTITITAHSRYEVDWGDGTAATGITSQGGPWPTGEITHPYQVDGTYRVTVRQRWTATWSATNGEQGAIDDGLQTLGTLDFPVQELQAVRDR